MRAQSRTYSITSSARASSVGGTVDAECFGRGEVYDKIKLGRLLDRNVGRFRATQNLIHHSQRRAPTSLGQFGP